MILESYGPDRPAGGSLGISGDESLVSSRAQALSPAHSGDRGRSCSCWMWCPFWSLMRCSTLLTLRNLTAGRTSRVNTRGTQLRAVLRHEYS